LKKNFCVFAASSADIAPLFYQAAVRLGTLLGQNGHTLVYGGGNCGLMGALARAVRAAGGKVTGVIPDSLRARELAYLEADHLHVTQDLRERKSLMEELADAFLVLPGGIGTLEEALEIMTLRQLGLLAKPLVFINTTGFYDPLFAFLDGLQGQGFLPAGAPYTVAATPEEAVEMAGGA
jgi:hypothetical protein